MNTMSMLSRGPHDGLNEDEFLTPVTTVMRDIAIRYGVDDAPEGYERVNGKLFRKVEAGKLVAEVPEGYTVKIFNLLKNKEGEPLIVVTNPEAPPLHLVNGEWLPFDFDADAPVQEFEVPRLMFVNNSGVDDLDLTPGSVHCVVDDDMVYKEGEPWGTLQGNAKLTFPDLWHAMKKVCREATDEHPAHDDAYDFRFRICWLQAQLQKMADHGPENAGPVKEDITNGVYTREITIPAGALIVGAIHRDAHPNYILRGDVSVVTEQNGVERLKGPCSIISPAGTKRVVFAHQETVWVTVHRTDAKTYEEAAREVIVDSYEEIGLNTPNITDMPTLSGGSDVREATEEA